MAAIRSVAAPSPGPARSGPKTPRVSLLASWACWAVAGACAAILVSMPLSVAAQATFGLTLLAAIAVLRSRVSGRVGRLAVMAAGGLIVARYMFWRLTSTLPDASDPVSFGLGLLLFGAEFYCAAMLAISLLVNLDPLARTTPEAGSDVHLPSVDVFIPTYNEDETILAMTVSAARALDYPADKLTVWLLDDGGTDRKCADPDPMKAAAAQNRRRSLQRLCAELGAVYSTRAANDHAKAGNLNAGLAKSAGEIVVVFDADHAPFRSFLRETIGCFAADQRLFLVQTPHVFLNPDPIERNLGTFASMPSENEMFYSATQRGLDKWNGSFFCGSAALLRRAALEEAGGFSGITITEDCETAFELHAKGWTSAFVDKPLIAGLQPETFADFVGQRSRWCQGMLQILMLKNPVSKRGLRPIQRVAYLSSMLFWLFPLPRLVFMIAPLLHIFLDVKIFVATIEETLAYTLVYVAANVLLQNALYGRLRWPWVSELYELVLGIFLWRAIVSCVVAPRKPVFNVTAKGQTLERDHLSPLAWPFVALFAALAIGTATAFYRYAFDPDVTDLMLVVGLWAVFNLVIAGVAMGTVAERRQPDRHPRLAVDRPVRLVSRDGRMAARVVNISAGGCTVRLDCASMAEPPEAGMQLGLELMDAPGPSLSLRIVHSRLAGPHSWEVSGEFTIGTTGDYRSIAALMYGDAGALARFLEGRRRPKGVLSGTGQFLAWSVSGPVRVLRLAVRGHLPAPDVTGESPVDTFDVATSRAALAAPIAPASLAHAARRSGPDATEWLELLVAAARDRIPSSDAVAADPRDLLPGASAAVLSMVPAPVESAADHPLSQAA